MLLDKNRCFVARWSRKRSVRNEEGKAEGREIAVSERTATRPPTTSIFSKFSTPEKQQRYFATSLPLSDSQNLYLRIFSRRFPLRPLARSALALSSSTFTFLLLFPFSLPSTMSSFLALPVALVLLQTPLSVHAWYSSCSSDIYVSLRSSFKVANVV